MIYNDLLNRSYELYKIDWCLARDVKVEDIDEEVGINGECYVSLNEFETNEFQDEAYMKLLLGANMFEHWQRLSKIEPEKGEVGIKVFFDGVHMDTVWVSKEDVDVTINSIARLGYDNYNADVKNDWERISESSNKPKLSFEVTRLPKIQVEQAKEQKGLQYRVVLTCFDPDEQPYADCNETLFFDKNDAYEKARSMASQECAGLNGEDGIGAPEVGCFEVDDCANNDFEVRWYEKRPEERGKNDCDIEYVTTYNVYPVEFTGTDVLSCKYRGFDIQQDGSLYNVYQNGICFGGGDNLNDALMLADDICLECTRDKTCALEAVHKVPLDVVIKFADQQQKNQGCKDDATHIIEDCR